MFSSEFRGVAAVLVGRQNPYRFDIVRSGGGWAYRNEDGGQSGVFPSKAEVVRALLESWPNSRLLGANGRPWTGKVR